MSVTSVSVKEVSDRQQYLDSLDDFVHNCQEQITSMLDSLGWTPEHFMKQRNLSECPHNKSHLVPKSSLDTHAARCQYKCQGYTKQEAERILEDTSYVYKDAPCVYGIKLDLKTMNSVLWNHHVQNHSVFYGYNKLPLLPEEEEQLLKREDRLALSEYIIKRAKQANRLKELGKDELLFSENLDDFMAKDGGERQLEPVEEMAAMRDFKRRRQTYRAKNVHITKKSHTEIMREVITNQMDMYTKSVMEESGHESNYEKGGGHSVTSDASEKYHYDRKNNDNSNRHRSRSSSKNRSSKKSHHRSRSRSKEKEHYKPRDNSCSTSKYSRSKYRSRSRSKDREDSRYKSKERYNKSDLKQRSESKDRGENYETEYKKYDKESRSPSSEKSQKSKPKKVKHKSKKRKRRHHSDDDMD